MALKSTGRLRDGLYRVSYKTVTAGFVVENGRVTRAAPILRRRLAYWVALGIRIGP